MKHSNLVSKLALPALACLTLAFLGGCDNSNSSNTNSNTKAQETVVKGKTMGTFYAVTIPDGYQGGKEALLKKADDTFAFIIDAISTFDKNAELAKFNDFNSTENFAISPYLAKVIEEAIYQARKIENAMDISVGPLVNLWGFGPDGAPEKIPAYKDVEETLKYVGYDKFGIYYKDGKAYLKKADPRVKLDLSTMGEGLGADALALVLEKEGVQNYLVSVAGAIVSKGKNSKGKDWTIGIEDPKGNGVFEVVCPHDMAMSTAGSYRNFYVDEKTGQHYSHIIDPKTGYPVSHKTVSVTVIAKSATETDALDTGLLVLGADKALEFGQKTNTAVYTIEIDDKGKAIGRHSKAFEPYLKCDVK